MVASVTLFGCGAAEDPNVSQTPIAVVPAEMQGLWGRDELDLPGLRVRETGYDYKELKVDITKGKVEGSDVVIERAETRWMKTMEKFSRCTGTIGIDGDRFFIRMFAEGRDTACESIVEGRPWVRWKTIDALPESLSGTFGLIGVPFELGKDGVKPLPPPDTTEAPLPITFTKLVADPESPDRVYVVDAKWGDREGLVGVVERSGEFVSGRMWSPDNPGETVIDFSGETREVDFSALPGGAGGGKFSNRKSTLTLTPNGKTVKVVLDTLGDGGVTCEYEVHDTETLPSTQQVSAGVPMMGGVKLATQRSKPTRTGDGCMAKATAQCETGFLYMQACEGEPTEELCPDTLYVKSDDGKSWKVAVTPQYHYELACLALDGEWVAIDG